SRPPKGAREVSGTEVPIKRVPELVPDDVARKSGLKLDQKAPAARPEEPADYDAIIFGTRRASAMAAQMRNCLDWRLALRRDHNRRQRRQPQAERQRVGPYPLPGPARRGDHPRAGRLSQTNRRSKHRWDFWSTASGRISGTTPRRA